MLCVKNDTDSARLFSILLLLRNENPGMKIPKFNPEQDRLAYTQPVLQKGTPITPTSTKSSSISEGKPSVHVIRLEFHLVRILNVLSKSPLIRKTASAGSNVLN